MSHQYSSDSSRQRNSRTFEYDAPTEDTPEALNFDGDDEEIREEESRVAIPLPNATFGQAIWRFYKFYWLNRGSASAKEFLYGMVWSLGSIVFCFTLTLWMSNVVERGGDSVSSLFRVLYMLMAYVAPGWLLVHIGPTFSLLKRYRNASVQ